MLRFGKYFPSLNCPNILLLTILALIAISPFDKAWTFWLSKHSVDGFANIFNRSIFEGEILGISDLGIFIYIGSLFLLLLSLKKIPSAGHEKISLLAGFLCYYGFLLGLGFVHPMKIIWGRKRPDALSGFEDSNFTQWYESGISTFHKINFAGSLPSGHTATFLMIIALIYCAYFLNTSPKFRNKVLVTGLFGFAACIAMGVSRSMSLKHWISDWILSIGFGWFLLHYLFFHIWQMDRLLLQEVATGNQPMRPKISMLISMPFILISLIFGLRLASSLWI